MKKFTGKEEVNRKMPLLDDLEALITKAKARSYSSTDIVDREIADKIKAILDNHETRIAALETP